jgi:hypothetical protein
MLVGRAARDSKKGVPLKAGQELLEVCRCKRAVGVELYYEGRLPADGR